MNLAVLLLYMAAIGSSMLAAEETQPTFARIERKPHPFKTVEPDVFPAASFVLHVDRHGAVTDAGLASSTGFGALDSLLLQAVREARFKPVVRWGLRAASCCSLEWRPDTATRKELDTATATSSRKTKQPTTLRRRRPELAFLPQVEHVLGQVVTEALVESSGVVIQARILKTSGNPRLDSAATRASLAWTFAHWKVSPARTDQTTLPVFIPRRPLAAREWVLIPFRFRFIYRRESAVVVHGKPPSE
jgi:TonB family protein